ncbi:TetR family transcriptional regulator [Nocardia tenerifensis]|uniref:TetR family transcriptional regulator n=1 Tax=Nocardia tenerifensis TaxID=228006 RepID=A0A318KIW2_9NOCA|nr:TetR/AcrR family transcriptional regulator [Nocardia tenerifensis]PXX60907.1 TetR family transcriptional regulator [Nocardia tenerifensis]
MRRRTAADTREHVLRVARDLFYRDGVRATGVDRVAAEAEVAPTTLYRLFASKDDLVAAYIEREAHLYREWFTAAVESTPDPRARILAVFDALTEQVSAPECRGCPFLMTLGEFPDNHLPAHQRAVATKTWVHAQFTTLTTALTPDASHLADELFLIMEGVYATTQSQSPENLARQARTLVDRLLPTPP